MKRTLTILGLLALIYQPVMAHSSTSTDDSNYNTGRSSVGGETSGIDTQGFQDQGARSVAPPETNYDENTGSDSKPQRRTESSEMNQGQGSQTGGAAGSFEDSTNGSSTVRGYW